MHTTLSKNDHVMNKYLWNTVRKNRYLHVNQKYKIFVMFYHT